MALVYRTRAGDTADWIAWKHYGAVDALTVRAVLEANPGLADYGPALPAGIDVTLPDVEQPASTVQGVKLWD